MKSFKKLMLSIWLILLIFYCGSYKAYFNTYYNAKRFYEAGINGSEEEVEKDNSKISYQAFNSAIAKFSKVLEVYSNSKYVDDSLLHLGKIFYFQEKYLDAEVKFSELITGFPESNLLAEAYLWRAKSLAKQGNYLNAENDYRYILELDDDDLRNEALIGLADLLFYQGSYKEAVNKYKSIVVRVEDNNIKSESQFQIGECYLLSGDYESAVKEYKKVQDFNPDNYYRFAAKYGMARALKFNRNFNEALTVLKELLKDGKNKDFYPLIELEIANCLEKKGDYKEAESAYKKLINYYKKGKEVARSYYNLGKINFNVYAKLDTSLSLFINAKNTVKDEYLKDSIDYKISKIKDIKKYSNETEKLYKQRIKLTTELEKMSEDDTSSVEDQAKAQNEYSKKKKGLQNIIKRETESRYALAEIYYTTTGWQDSALVQLKNIVEKLNITQQTPLAYYMLSKIYQANNNDLSENYFNQLIEKFPKSDIVFYLKSKSGDSLYDRQVKNSENIYLSAEKLIFDDNHLDEGIDSLKKIFNEYPNTPYAPKSLFTLGWIHEYYLGDSSKTVDYYYRVSEDYPYSDYAQKGNKRLNMILSGKKASQEKYVREKKPKSKTSVGKKSPDKTTSNETMPVIVSDVKAEYVESEREKGFKGIVTVSMVVNKQGKVILARVQENNTGSKLLGESAVEAAKQCLFIPAKKGDKPTVKRILKKFYFGVEKDD